MSQHQQQNHIELLDKKLDHHQLVLYNDDVNTFDFVIESLIEVCRHDRQQAEQCTLLVHYKGKCTVKEGTFNVLRPLCEALLDRGLSSVIE
jgi:ATP-dependent Clp protease adaptor protein ClpS